MVTNLRERIRAELTEYSTQENDGILMHWTSPPSEKELDKLERLFNEMLAEQKVGNGS